MIIASVVGAISNVGSPCLKSFVAELVDRDEVRLNFARETVGFNILIA